jgi:hypothetical protein
MKRILYFFLAASLALTSCGNKDKVKYDPYGKGQRGEKTTKEVVEKRQKGFDVQFTTENGVRYVMVTMNGVSGVKAIFDTGCSSMSISEMELLNLIKGGTINETDVGVTKVSIADGTELTIPQVRMNVTLMDTKGQEHSATVESGVQANLIANVLIGNAVFNQMGTVITIDDNKGVIHFEQ